MKRKVIKGIIVLLVILSAISIIYVIHIKLEEEKQERELQIKYNDLWLVTKALKFDADIVEKDGQVELENIDYDEHELAMSLGAYNWDNGTDYSIDDMKKSIESPNDDTNKADKQLLDDFMKWYSLQGQGKSGKVKKYKKLLSDEYVGIKKKYPEMTTYYMDLNFEQIREIEKYIENPAYEIDVTLWK